MSRLTLIVAATKTNGIGQNGGLPWRLPKEMSYFARATTTAPEGRINAVIMGRNTWESIPKKFRPLKDRVNVVLTGKEGYDLGSYVGSVHSLYDSLSIALAVADALAPGRPSHPRRSSIPTSQTHSLVYPTPILTVSNLYTTLSLSVARGSTQIPSPFHYHTRSSTGFCLHGYWNPSLRGAIRSCRTFCRRRTRARERNGKDQRTLR